LCTNNSAGARSIRKPHLHLHFHWNIWFTLATVLLFVGTGWMTYRVSIEPSGVPASPSAAAEPLPLTEAEVSHPDRLPSEIEKLDASSPDTAWQKRRDRLTQESQDRLFSNRLHGPYSIGVLDKLNEMVIGTSLQAYGVSTSEAPLRLGSPVLSAIPSSMPTYGYISSNFGYRRSPFTSKRVHHNGIDIAVNHGSPVYATADGIVTLAGNRFAMGKMVTIDHGFGIVTRYGHNSNVLVNAGDFVQKGETIALSGSTGRSTGAHLHYEVWVNGEVVDPTKFMFDVPPAALTQTAELVASQESQHQGHGPFRLGFAVGGESGEFHSSPDWVTAFNDSRRFQTVATLFILALFASVSAFLVMAAGYRIDRDYTV
jgi:murein DD-endopeptidase MepM/ murein hydrolase activator NlpD